MLLGPWFLLAGVATSRRRQSNVSKATWDSVALCTGLRRQAMPNFRGSTRIVLSPSFLRSSKDGVLPSVRPWHSENRVYHPAAAHWRKRDKALCGNVIL